MIKKLAYDLIFYWTDFITFSILVTESEKRNMCAGRELFIDHSEYYCTKVSKGKNFKITALVDETSSRTRARA